jgi:hypothetical protein
MLNKISCKLKKKCLISSENFISRPVFPLIQSRLYCFLIGLGMRFTPTLECIVFCTTAILAPHVPISQDELYCILIGLGIRFTPTLACIMYLHYYYKAPCVSIGQGLGWSRNYETS